MHCGHKRMFVEFHLSSSWRARDRKDHLNLLRNKKCHFLRLQQQWNAICFRWYFLSFVDGVLRVFSTNKRVAIFRRWDMFFFLQRLVESWFSVIDSFVAFTELYECFSLVEMPNYSKSDNLHLLPSEFTFFRFGVLEHFFKWVLAFSFFFIIFRQVGQWKCLSSVPWFL